MAGEACTLWLSADADIDRGLTAVLGLVVVHVVVIVLTALLGEWHGTLLE
jgi:hypothetical protein